MKFWDKKEPKRLFKERHFTRSQLKNHKLNVLRCLVLRELPFYDELCIVKTSKAFKGHARSYCTDIIDSKDPSV